MQHSKTWINRISAPAEVLYVLLPSPGRRSPVCSPAHASQTNGNGWNDSFRWLSVQTFVINNLMFHHTLANRLFTTPYTFFSSLFGALLGFSVDTVLLFLVNRSICWHSRLFWVVNIIKISCHEVAGKDNARQFGWVKVTCPFFYLLILAHVSVFQCRFNHPRHSLAVTCNYTLMMNTKIDVLLTTH